MFQCLYFSYRNILLYYCVILCVYFRTSFTHPTGSIKSTAREAYRNFSTHLIVIKRILLDIFGCFQKVQVVCSTCITFGFSISFFNYEDQVIRFIRLPGICPSENKLETFWQKLLKYFSTPLAMPSNQKRHQCSKNISLGL